jgi:nucleotide-binding universal stress UspA family protein
LHRFERMKTVVDLAMAIAEAQDGDVLVFRLASSETAQSSLEEKVRDYEPLIGDRVPYLARQGRWRSQGDGLAEALSQFDFDLLLISASDSLPEEEQGVVDMLEGALVSPQRDTGIVYDHGLESVKRVLLATAGGSNARAAAPLVLNVVKAFGAQLRIVYVVSPGQEEGKEAGLSRISDTLESVNVADVEVEKNVIVSDNAIQAIVEQAQDCDLLMLGGSPPGRRGRFNPDNFATQIARKSGVTTVIVYARRREQQSWIKRVFLGSE